MRYPLIVVLILTTITVSFGVILEDVYDWKYVDFRWKNERHKEDAINSGKYNASSCALFDVDLSRDGRVFVTSVRYQGVPASLMTISTEIGPGGPLLDPYPNWSWYNDINDCNGIISVYRVSIKCNYLFALDCGKIGEDAVCPPKLLIFDLETNMLIKNIIIPPHIFSNENGTGLLVTPLVHVNDCNNIHDATVYMADTEGYGLAMYNENSGFCRIESTFMKATNPYFTIENQSFYLEDGILGLTYINKELFYSVLAGNKMYKMNMCNKQKCSELNKNEADKLTRLAGTLSGQTAAIASEQCAIFFSNIPDTSILCKDATKEFNSANTVLIAQDSEKLQFASGMKVANHGTLLMTLTNRFQRVFTDTLDLNETNFRILTMDIAQIREETKCFASCSNDHNKPGRHGHGHGRPWYDRPWYDRPWYDRPWYNNKHNKLNKYDKDDNISKQHKDDNTSKQHKDDKDDNISKQHKDDNISKQHKDDNTSKQHKDDKDDNISKQHKDDKDDNISKQDKDDNISKKVIS